MSSMLRWNPESLKTSDERGCGPSLKVGQRRWTKAKVEAVRWPLYILKGLEAVPRSM